MYLIKKYQFIIIVTLALITIGGASSIYFCIYDRDLGESIILSLQIFALDTKIPNDFGMEIIPENWKKIYIFSFTGFLTSFFTVILLFLDKIISKVFLNRIKNKEFILVCGLGRNNRIYIDSELKTKEYPLLIIENNKDNLYIDNYKEKQVGVIIGDASDENIFDEIKLENIRHIIVSVGNDMKNLEIATKILKKSNQIKLYIHLENRNLRYFHKEKGLLQGSNIKLYSYYEDASRELFENYDIEGRENEILCSEEQYSIIIFGNGNLAYEIIFQACIMGQLPNENKLTIYCLDKNPKKFKQKVELNYTEIQNVPNVEFKYIKFDIDSKSSYLKDLWYEKNLTNIILCHEDEQINLSVAANLADITYLEKIEKKQLKTNIILAIFNEYGISDSIKSNKNTYENFFTFGLTKDICTKKYLIDEIRDEQAKATNEIYNEQSLSNNNLSNIKLWEERSYFEKESNRTSADHIKIKKKYLNYDTSDQAKELLAKCEHNRWNAFHFLNGWKYAIETDKSIKLHKYLLPYNSLSEEIKKFDREMIGNIEKIINYKIKESL